MNADQGLIFHIIHGSFVDGYGIRTTVFLKGCPLRCIWCCNPEGQEVHPELKFNVLSCNGCGKCVPVCPVQAILPATNSGTDRVRIDRGLCTDCGKCIEVCYTGALDFFGKYYNVDEIFDIVKRDEQFYRASGGGLTIGGGEPTFQPRFTLSLIRKCKENYIHTAVDTCGHTVSDEGKRVLEEADLLLYDIKGIDADEHLRNTGVTNERILSNLKTLNAMGKAIIIRVPLIPGFTDSDKNIRDTAEFLSGLKSVERVDIMAYHAYGGIKYAQLGREYRLQGMQSYTEERLAEIKQIFERYGLNVQLGG